MKSSSGKYFIGLDHVRALAAFMVFSWHFIGTNNGFDAAMPIFPLSLLAEGHTGVSIFMVLSGYLFAKLLNGKNILYKNFFWNRFLRLVPLLMFVIVLNIFKVYFSGLDMFMYLKSILIGVAKPPVPNGVWSIFVEFNFYLILPILLFLSKRNKFSLLYVLFAALLLRYFLYQYLGQIQTLSYWTIIGRVDQFLLGILVFQFRGYFAHKHLLISINLIVFSVFYWYFDSQGGFYHNITYPSPSQIWIYMPTIEGIAYALLIVWYDNSFKHSNGRVSRFIALIGTYSYSIYLLHFFIVFQMPNFINTYIIDISNIHLAMLFSLLCFLLIVPIGYLSYRFIEAPFLKFRTQYILDNKGVVKRKT